MISLDQGRQFVLTSVYYDLINHSVSGKTSGTISFDGVRVTEVNSLEVVDSL